LSPAGGAQGGADAAGHVEGDDQVRLLGEQALQPDRRVVDLAGLVGAAPQADADRRPERAGRAAHRQQRQPGRDRLRRLGRQAGQRDPEIDGGGRERQGRGPGDAATAVERGGGGQRRGA
jgi:hypothetical protein